MHYRDEQNYAPEVLLGFDPHEIVMRYEVFFDLSCSEMIRVALENEPEGIFTFNFITLHPDDINLMDDYTPIEELEDQIPHCVTPIYIGNINHADHREVIHQFLQMAASWGAMEEIGYYDDENG